MSARDEASAILNGFTNVVIGLGDYKLALRCCTESKAEQVLEFLQAFKPKYDSWVKAVQAYPVGMIPENKKKTCTKLFNEMIGAWRKRPKIPLKRGKTTKLV